MGFAHLTTFQCPRHRFPCCQKYIRLPTGEDRRRLGRRGQQSRSSCETSWKLSDKSIISAPSSRHLLKPVPVERSLCLPSGRLRSPAVAVHPLCPVRPCILARQPPTAGQDHVARHVVMHEHGARAVDVASIIGNSKKLSIN